MICLYTEVEKTFDISKDHEISNIHAVEAYRSLVQSMERVKDKLVTAQGWFPFQKKLVREKRAAALLLLLAMMGLLGIVNLSFNIANIYEINELKGMMQDYSKAIANINLVNLQQTRRLNLVIEGLERTNVLLEDVQYNLQVTTQLLNVKLVLDNVEAELDFLVTGVKQDFKKIIHAADGKMTPNILLFENL